MGLLLILVAVPTVLVQERAPMTPEELEQAPFDEAVRAMDAISPQEAAQLMEQISPDKAAEIAGEMDTSHAAGMLSAMDAEKAGPSWSRSSPTSWPPSSNS